jgi:hypothetical protein
MGYNENHFWKHWTLLLELREARDLCLKNTEELCTLTIELNSNLCETRKLCGQARQARLFSDQQQGGSLSNGSRRLAR